MRGLVGNKGADNDDKDLNLEQTDESIQYAAFRNQRLGTPRMKKIMNKKDASCMLKDEINESMLRMKAAKFGHSIEDIAPQYKNSYYLPNKQMYLPEKAPKKKKNNQQNAARSQISFNNQAMSQSQNGSRYDGSVR